MSNDDERKMVRECETVITANCSQRMMTSSRSFSDLSDEALEVRFPSSSAPDWRTYQGGLNVEGE